MAQLMPLPLTVSCFSKIKIGFTFLVPAHLGSPGKGPLNGCVCVTCEMQNFSIWMKVWCIPSNVDGSEKSWLWDGGSEKNRLWFVATRMSGKHCHSKCSKWQPSAWIHASSLFATDQLRSTLCCAEIQPMSQQATAASRPYQYMCCTPPVACPRSSTMAMQIIGSTKQQ